MDLTGITNENEFYTHHYLSAVLENDPEDRDCACAKESTSTEKLPGVADPLTETPRISESLDEASQIVLVHIGQLGGDALIAYPTDEALRDVRRASEEWIRLLGWDKHTLEQKSDEMQQLVDTYMKTAPGPTRDTARVQ